MKILSRGLAITLVVSGLSVSGFAMNQTQQQAKLNQQELGHVIQEIQKLERSMAAKTMSSAALAVAGQKVQVINHQLYYLRDYHKQMLVVIGVKLRAAKNLQNEIIQARRAK